MLTDVPALTKLEQLYQYFDDLVSRDADSDTLFASSYLRGFIALAASQFGDEQQTLGAELVEDVSEKLAQARTELTPQDREIVQQFWQQLQTYFG
ncbi:YfcL family protein [Endozoicomonas sp. G2_1]|uniref:YfcL family protein n=1 Tax=Endozoicomonas sp. G2_1 TaxID=2821091 RepID=UPI001ADAB88B|nr:YfcL family protein [Endozoicomonas sp. G2_1]MBO9491726.1 YfcL family protein [Endozoicomonas sp. G2_1]